MLEQLSGDDDVEADVGKVERLVEIGPAGLDPQAGRLGEGVLVGVYPDDLVAGQVGLCQRPVTAAEVEHSPPRPADITLEQLLALRPCEDEAAATLVAVVLGVAPAELLQAHGGSKVHLRR